MSDKPRASKVKKLLIGAGVAVPVVLIGAYVLVPVVASSIAPGKIEAAAAGAINGRVKVTGVKTGWSGPTTIEKIELLDEQGKSVGTFSAQSSLGIWSFLGSLEDLGTLSLSGDLSVVRTTDGKGNTTTNFERAVASRKPAAPAEKPAAAKPLRVKVAATVNKLRLKYSEVNASGVAGTSVQMDDLTGSAVIDSIGAAPRADINLAGTFTGSGAPSGAGVKVGVKLDQFLDAKGQFAVDKALIDASVTGVNVPVALIDALASQGGMLSGALGENVTFSVLAKGNSGAANASVDLRGPNATVDAKLTLASGKVTIDSPARVSVNSLGFVLERPEVRKALTDSGITIDGAPRLDATISKLAWPIAAGTDLRGSMIEANLNLAAINGGVRIENRPVQRLALTPTVISVTCTDPSAGARIVTRTSATLDGVSAGEISADVAISGLVDAKGMLAPSSSRTVAGTLSLARVSAALVQPFVSGAGVPVVVREDFGETLDVTLERTPFAKAEKLALSLRSTNVQVQAPITLTSELQSCERFTVTVNSIDPLMRRIAQKPGSNMRVWSSGVSTFEGSFSIPVKNGAANPGAGTMSLRGSLSGLGAQLGSEPPVELRGVSVSADSMPGKPIKLSLASSAVQNNQTATLTGDVTIDGLMGGKRSPEIAGLGAMRVSGQLTAKQVAGSMVESLGRATGALSDPSSAAIVRQLFGNTSELAVDLKAGAGDAQEFKLDLKSSNTQAKAAGALRPSELEISSFNAQADATPALLAEFLRSLNTPGSGTVVSAQGNSNVKLSLAQGVTLPLAKDAKGVPTFGIDFASAAARSAKLNASMDRIALIGLDASAPNASFGAEQVKIDATVPLAMLGQKAKSGQLEATVSAGLLKDNAKAGTLTGNVSMPAGGAATGTLKVAGIPTPLIDVLAKQPGMVSGALGPTASMTVTSGGSGANSELTLGLQSQNLTLEGVKLAMDDTSVRLKSPVSCTFVAPAAWADKFALGRTPQTPGNFSMGGPVELKLALRQFAIARSKDVPGQASTGIFKPGVFALDADVSVASVPLLLMGTDKRGARTSTNATLDGLTAKVQSSSDGSMTIGARLSKATMGSVTTGEPITLDAKLRGLAGADGQIDVHRASKDLTLKAPKIPTQIVQSLLGAGIDLVQILGPEMNAQIVGTNISSVSGGGMLDAQLTSAKASARLSGPVDQGVLRVQSNTPLNVSLSEFEYKDQSKILSVIPLFASMSKLKDLTGKAPTSMVTSNDLTIPLDGDMRKLNGQLTVDVGQFQYEMLSEMGTFFDLGKLKTKGAASVDRFLVDIRGGVATYKDARLTLSNIPINNQGSIDLVNNTIDVTTFIPTVGASAGLMGQISNSLGGALGKLTGDTLSIPLRTYGPMDNPKREVDLKAIGDSILKQPGRILDGVGGLLDGLKPKKK